MIIGIGTDIMEIEKIKESILFHEKFTSRVFTDSEITYCQSQPDPYQHFTVRFAAKEAVMKALGTGWDAGIQWRNIEVIREGAAAPYIRLHNKSKWIAEQLEVNHIWLSLSHSGNYATAMVVIEK